MIIPAGGIQNISRFLPPVQGEESDAPIATSYLGTPVYSNLIIAGVKNTRGATQDLVFDTVMIEVNQEKNIVRTPIQGRKGTVKEYISMGDYNVTINGMIVSEFSNVLPKDQIENLRELLELPESLEVSSEFLQLFSIHNIVVLGFEIGQMMGYRNQVPFQIRAIDDEPIEVKEL